MKIIKSFKIETKQVDNETMSLEAVIFTKDGEPDLDGDTYDKDIVVSIEKEPLPMLAMHDRYNLPIGKVNEIDDSSDVVTFDGLIYRDISTGSDVAKLIERDLLDSVSMGFYPNKYDVIEDDDLPWGIGFNFTDISLSEISVVDIPAVPEAVITDFKALQKGWNSDDKLRNYLKVRENFTKIFKLDETDSKQLTDLRTEKLDKIERLLDSMRS